MVDHLDEAMLQQPSRSRRTYMCRDEKAQGPSLGEEAVRVDRVYDSVNLQKNDMSTSGHSL